MPIQLDNADTAPWLSAALKELAEVDEDARDAELPEPSELAKNGARNFLNALSDAGVWRGPDAIYADDDGGVAVLWQDGNKQASILVICEADGAGTWFAHLDGRNHNARHEFVVDLPDQTLRAYLERMR